jgi:hypothetical protein
VLATKFGGATSEDVNGTPGKVQGHPDYVARAVEGSLRRLGVDPIDTCRELGIGFVAYSPLGRGFLTGTIRSIDDLPDDDFRRISPRFQGANFDANLAVVDRVHEIAERKDVAASALAPGVGACTRRGHRADPGHHTPRKPRTERRGPASNPVRTGICGDRGRRARGVAAGERYPAPMMTQVNH